MILIVKLRFVLSIGAAALGLLGGCGQPGPLYLPKAPAKPAAPIVQPAPVPSSVTPVDPTSSVSQP